MSSRRNSFAVSLAAIFTVAAPMSPAQSSPERTLRAPIEIQNAYARAKPYLDYPPPLLKDAVPALHGLKPDESQDQLKSILARTGRTVADLLPRVPNLIAREDFSNAQMLLPYLKQDGSQQAFSPQSQSQMSTLHQANERELQESLHAKLQSPPQWRQFNYLIVSHPAKDLGSVAGSGVGSVLGSDLGSVLDEYRTDEQDHSVETSGQGAQNPRGIGFAYLWLMFLPENLSQARFRYLGSQKIEKHETFVVGFAQEPDHVRLPGVIRVLGTDYPLFSQGVVWIDQETFRIVRMQTDLLAPLPSLQLQWTTAEIHFSEVRIPDLPAPLWLPREIEITWEQGVQASAELHRYSKYRLFRATSKLVPAS